jgi:hypothetical protein
MKKGDLVEYDYSTYGRMFGYDKVFGIVLTDVSKGGTIQIVTTDNKKMWAVASGCKVINSAN